jgi:hypothetical protein
MGDTDAFLEAVLPRMYEVDTALYNGECSQSYHDVVPRRAPDSVRCGGGNEGLAGYPRRLRVARHVIRELRVLRIEVVAWMRILPEIGSPDAHGVLADVNGDGRKGRFVRAVRVRGGTCTLATTVELG